MNDSELLSSGQLDCKFSLNEIKDVFSGLLVHKSKRQLPCRQFTDTVTWAFSLLLLSLPRLSVVLHTRAVIQCLSNLFAIFRLSSLAAAETDDSTSQTIHALASAPDSIASSSIFFIHFMLL